MLLFTYIKEKGELYVDIQVVDGHLFTEESRHRK